MKSTISLPRFRNCTDLSQISSAVLVQSRTGLRVADLLHVHCVAEVWDSVAVASRGVAILHGTEVGLLQQEGLHCARLCLRCSSATQLSVLCASTAGVLQ